MFLNAYRQTSWGMLDMKAYWWGYKEHKARNRCVYRKLFQSQPLHQHMCLVIKLHVSFFLLMKSQFVQKFPRRSWLWIPVLHLSVGSKIPHSSPFKPPIQPISTKALGAVERIHALLGQAEVGQHSMRLVVQDHVPRWRVQGFSNEPDLDGRFMVDLWSKYVNWYGTHRWSMVK